MLPIVCLASQRTLQHWRRLRKGATDNQRLGKIKDWNSGSYKEDEGDSIEIDKL